MTIDVNYRQCFTADGHRKVQFYSRKEAIKVRSLNPAKKKRMRAYLCPRCGYYHLGHMRVTDP